MDPFTERILERARERQKKLKELSGEESGNEPNETETDSAKTGSVRSSKGSSIEELVSFDCDRGSQPELLVNKETDEGNRPKFARQGSSKTRVSSEMIGTPHAPHQKTLNIQRDSFNMEIKVSSSDKVRVEVEIEEEQPCSDQENNDVGSVGGGLREDAKNRLKRLGKLYAGGEDANISSPIHRTETEFLMHDEEKEEHCLKAAPKKGLSRLAALARDINTWEDNITQKKIAKAELTSPKKSWKPPAPQPPYFDCKSPAKPSVKKNPAPKPPSLLMDKENDLQNKMPDKRLQWDKKVLESLESQGFQRTNSNSRLIYNYNNHNFNDNILLRPESIPEESNSNCSESHDIDEAQKTSPLKKTVTPTQSKSPLKARGTEVANKAAVFETSLVKNVKDPALLSVSERKALFEKNKGSALLPKAAFAMPVPVKKSDDNGSKKVNENNCSKGVIKTIDCPKSTGIASKVAALLENRSTISQEQIDRNVREERQKDLDLLLNRFNKNREVVVSNKRDIETSSEDEIDEKAPMMVEKRAAMKVGSPGENKNNRQSGSKRTKQANSPKVAAVLEDVKRIKVTTPKAGHLYPCLSDIEATTETEQEQADSNSSSENSFEDYREHDKSGNVNTSFGREILQFVSKKHSPQKRPILDESTESDISDMLDSAADDYLDEAAAYDSNSSAAGPTPPKQGKKNLLTSTETSDSFSYKKFPSDSSSDKYRSPVITDTPPMDQNVEYIIDGEKVVPLTHTVSFYRRQQNEASKTPRSSVKQLSRKAIIEEEEEEMKRPADENNDEVVEKKIKELLQEVNKQQMIIAQTSQALNLCNSTMEFMGSMEQVEAERVLLLASHRRTAALNEIQRLKVEGTLRPQNQHSQNVPLEKGTLLITDLALPLKREYVRALAAAGGKGHHVVCLVKSDEQVVATSLVSTVAGSKKNLETKLAIPGAVKLENVYSDFTVTLEVYCLQAQEEILPHEVKYHINSKKALNKLTPKKQKNESRLIAPPKESPAGPQVVRTPSFALMGYAILSIQAVNRSQWSLNNAPSMSPLEGVVEMKVLCELAVSAEKYGFLTMFEDVSGFGAWHRRWCHLKGDVLSYWKYPDDEKKTPPMGTVDLRSCITERVGPVSREICARLHTVLLERERETLPGDKDTLTTISKNGRTIVRHLLSADTKEERIAWSAKFNEALIAIRMWGN